MLAENEMDVQQSKRKVIDLDSWCRKATSDPSLLEGVPNETLKVNLQYSSKLKHTRDKMLMQ
jgi:hypothetical protein